MKTPSRKLIGIAAIFVAIGVITATGAFSTVSADRTATITVADDSAALLALEAAPGGNGGYVSTDTGNDGVGIMELDLSGVGVNDEGTTDIKNVFTITNNGQQAVDVTLTDSDTGENTGESDAVTFYNETMSGVSLNDGGLENGNTVTLQPGESVTVSIYIDTVGVDDTDGNDLVDEISISASAT